jgi:aspartyl-tRNA(Asn)/glutamyl-tRNA(Gln) amidotransferase subunit C
MPLNKSQVLHVASLARLALTDSEVESLVTDLGNILKYVEQLSELDTAEVEPTEHLAVEELPLQDDEPRPGLSHEQALAGAPKTLNDGFAVPAFVEEG